MSEAYNPKDIEAKWQARWRDEKSFAARQSSAHKKMYVLDMFPYPSGDGLHVGHVKIYTASDIAARYLRLKGFNVLHPTGWDAFGLPTENTAIKKGVHPAKLTADNIKRFRQQMQRMGFSYDWDREINTTDPAYYKWTQWIFLQLFKMGLAYQDTIPINWCPSCKTGLANEEVVDGKCDRCGTPVAIKLLRQWMLRITKYADQLLEGLGGLDWPKFVKELQTNWIGRSEGAQIVFLIEGLNKELPVFTTRPDTLFGATYIVLSPGHPMVAEITTPEQKKTVDAYAGEAQKPVRLDPAGEKDKTGVFTGGYAINPINSRRIPIWVADYVLMTYGAGAIMAVPAHDERDHAFAQKYSLPIQQVIVPEKAQGEVDLPYTGPGVLINSGRFDGQPNIAAGATITTTLQLKRRARKAVQYKLRDWVFSRQRYWGEPIPIIHCAKCGTVPVPEKDLPVELPVIDQYEPTGTGESPLAAIAEWVNVKCPTCFRQGKRETNTMPQWAGSSWYWLRYITPQYAAGIAEPAAMKHWLPVDLYVGGAEHAVLHLLYARFWQKALFAAGIVPTAEPFQRFRAVGLVLGEDGQKMSKSRGNVLNPDDVVSEYGADTLRIYEMFMGPFENSVAWNTDSIKGARRFLDRVWELAMSSADKDGIVDGPDVQVALHQAIRRVSESTEQFKFNTAISALMELLNLLSDQRSVSRQTLATFILLLSPYAPHIADELLSKLGNEQPALGRSWPQYDEKILARAQVAIPIQINGKVRGQLEVERGLSQAEIEQQARQIANVSKYLAGGQVTKVVFVPDRLLNFVTQ